MPQPQLDTDFSFRQPDPAGAMVKGMQIKHIQDRLAAYPEDRAWDLKERGWKEEDRARALKKHAFKDEDDALDYMIKSAPMITYDNYMDSKQHLEELGLNPDFLPSIESFGEPGSPEARSAFDKYRSEGMVSLKERVEKIKSTSKTKLQTQKDTAAAERGTDRDIAAMKRSKVAAESRIKAARIRANKISDSNKLSFAEKEQYKYLIGKLENIDEKLTGEWSEDLKEEDIAKYQAERNTIIEGMKTIENKVGGGGVGMSAEGKTAGNPEAKAALEKIKAAGHTKEDVRAFIKENPNATIGDALKHFGISNEGLRVDGTKKGSGFLGTLKRPDGRESTELSVGVEINGKETEIPTLVPTLTKTEIDHLLSGKEPTQAIVNKAVEYAKKRIAQGKSPFKQEGEGKSGMSVAHAGETPDVKNEPVKRTPMETPSRKGLQRQQTSYQTSMTAPGSKEQEEAAIQELTDLANKLGVGVGNWKALGQLAKDLGGWAWDSYQRAWNSLAQGQEESREQLPGYSK